ncbi:MAG: LacI family DNA-binding transcriptional regulator [Pseudomonadota bacterium]
MSPSRRPTMSDVARLAGVSVMTVSRALKPETPVNETTRARIQAAAEELGYVLDSTAAGLSSRHSGFVAMTVPSLNNSNFSDTARGLTEGLRGSAFDLLLGYTNYDLAEEERLIAAFLRRRPEAIVVTGGAHSTRCRSLLKASGVPVIETWDLPEKPIDRVVGFSNAEAGRLMACHLHGQGYRRIGFVGGDSARDTRGADRCRGFLAALAELSVCQDRVVSEGTPPLSMSEGAAAMEKLLDRWPDTQAVMCVSDLSAFGAMSAAQRRGLTVPHDIAICGFGAYDIAEHALPAITTLDMSAEGIGRKAAEMIIDALGRNGPSTLPHRLEIAYKLVVRGSTAPLLSR